MIGASALVDWKWLFHVIDPRTLQPGPVNPELEGARCVEEDERTRGERGIESERDSTNQHFFISTGGRRRKNPIWIGNYVFSLPSNKFLRPRRSRGHCNPIETDAITIDAGMPGASPLIINSSRQLYDHVRTVAFALFSPASPRFLPFLISWIMERDSFFATRVRRKGAAGHFNGELRKSRNHAVD